MIARLCEVRLEHAPDEVSEADRRLPTEGVPGVRHEAAWLVCQGRSKNEVMAIVLGDAGDQGARGH
jgi:hypothetical protein